jgi:hypothetical protein
MKKTENQKQYQRAYRKKHPEFDKIYRKKHKAKIAEYNRLHPELRVRLSLDDHARLKSLFGDEISKGIKGLIQDVFHQSQSSDK